MSNELKKQFVWSDLHIGHANVITFDQRPFESLGHMHTVLANNYNSTVPDDGICYFLGDMGLCKAEELKKFMKRLNRSTKVLLLGNHDRGMHAMYAQGFDVVLNTAVVYIGKSRVSMSHCPLPGIFREDVTNMKGAKEGESWHGEHKNQMFTSQDLTVDFHLHGHCHSDGVIKPRTLLNQFDVGVRCNKYRPVSFSEIESWIASVKKNEQTS